MTVGADSQENEVKDGETDRVLGSECLCELGDVVLGGFFGVGDKVGVDGVDVLLGDVDVVEELGLGEEVV